MTPREPQSTIVSNLLSPKIQIATGNESALTVGNIKRTAEPSNCFSRKREEIITVAGLDCVSSSHESMNQTPAECAFCANSEAREV